MKYVVFLDIDGVLTSGRVHIAHNAEYPIWSKFDPIAVDFFNKIHDTYDDVHFVLTTTWKEKFQVDDIMEKHLFLSIFATAGFRGRFAIVWKTGPYEESSNSLDQRAEEVKDYINTHNPKDYIIFDDTNYPFNSVLGIKRFIKCDPDNGLLRDHMLNAQSIMGTWDKKHTKIG